MPDDRMKEPRDPERASPSQSNTVTAQGETQSPKPRMPHERDESSDSQAPEAAASRRMGQIAHEDVAEGQVDTDKGPPMDATYERVKEGEPKKRTP